MYKCKSVQSRSEMVQAESVSIEENLVITGSVCQYEQVHLSVRT